MRISDWSSDVCSSDLEADGVAGGAEIAPYEGDVAGFDGDVGAGAHGEAEVGLGEGGGVVDAVTDHGHRAALSLEADRKSVVWGESVSVRVGLGGRRIIKKRKKMI